ncbi:MAG: LPS export ABC transporter ATP-binding protein [Candidatus Bipolaricaulota bacterium]|nr:LPS export ABC transporter ATP-binding protein [Candidatus Bipolaricaulota bacterium]
MSGLLEGEGLVRSFGRRKAVDGLSVAFRSGEVTGLLGPNGAGKTTTLYLLVGFLRPQGGRVRLDGREVTGLPFYLRARAGIHYLPQEPSVFLRTTVRGNLRLALEGLRLRWSGDVDRVVDELGLRELLSRPVGRLSAGERRKVEVARALVARPRFLLLDEPFSGVDPLTVAELSSLLRRLAQGGIGIAICDHNVRDTLRITDRAYLIHHGRLLCAGTPDEVLAHPGARQAYLGEGFAL